MFEDCLKHQFLSRGRVRREALEGWEVWTVLLLRFSAFRVQLIVLRGVLHGRCR